MFKFILPALFLTSTAVAQICNPTGNVVVYSNYDGGVLDINVDVNIPNLKIGIVTYEAVQVNFSGAYVNNITAVEYAGYNNSPNTNCNPSVPTTSFSGVPVGVTPSINFAPAVTYSDPNGYGNIICGYSCTTGNQGGCNTAPQIYDYFQNVFSGSIYFHFTQYNCWVAGQSHALSAGGNCCLSPPLPAPVANASVSSDTICAGECVSFTDLSSNLPNAWLWDFPGATTSSSTAQNPSGICYPAPGNYIATLTSYNNTGNDSFTIPVVVQGVNTATSTSGLTITAAASPATYQWIDCNTGTPISGATSGSYTATSNGSYAVIVTEDGCMDTSACTVIAIVASEDLVLGDMLSIHPNPSTGKFYVQDTKGALLGQKITVSNVLGEVILRAEISSPSTLLDLSNQGKGMYFIAVESAAGTLVTSVLKE